MIILEHTRDNKRTLFAVSLYGRPWKSQLFIVNCSFFMAFIDEILQKPSYGWMDAKGLFLKPTTRQLFKEAFSRINIFKTRKNWIALISWFMATCMLPIFVVFSCIIYPGNRPLWWLYMPWLS